MVQKNELAKVEPISSAMYVESGLIFRIALRDTSDLI